MTRAHAAAVVARLRLEDLAGCVFWDEKIPDKTAMYLRVRTNTGARAITRLAGPHGPIRQTFWLTGVGISPSQAAWVLEQATEQLLNWVPTVPGWSCHRMTPEASQPVDADPDVDNRYFAVDQWDLFSEPISA